MPKREQAITPGRLQIKPLTMANFSDPKEGAPEHWFDHTVFDSPLAELINKQCGSYESEQEKHARQPRVAFPARGSKHGRRNPRSLSRETQHRNRKLQFPIRLVCGQPEGRLASQD